MSRLKTAVVSTFLVLSSLYVSNSAHALQVVRVTLAGGVGVYGSQADGRSYLMFQDAEFGFCNQFDLGSRGLWDDFRIEGSSQGDTILPVLSGSVTFCGRVLRPLITNGRIMTIRGFGGNDLVANGIGRGSVNGDEGNDFVTAGSGGGTNLAFGGNGNDWVSLPAGSTNVSTVELNGDAGDDILCNRSSGPISRMSGGNNRDQCCGLATLAQSCEVFSCSGC